MGPISEYDPRLLPLSVVGFEVAPDQALPCGQDICTPLQNDCVETGTNRSQAVLSCGRFMAATALTERNAELSALLSSHEQLIEQLSIDRKTGILTLNANDALFNRLQATGLLERMREEGYVLQLTFGDIDKLKDHNTLGDHAGGDEAIRAGVNVLRGLYRREYDVVGILEHERQAAEAIDDTSGFTSVSRFAAGDELIVMSFLPPTEQGDDRRRPPTATDLQAEVARIVDAFDGLYVEYPIKRGINVAEMHAKLAEEGFVFGMAAAGRVRAPVSMTFATVLSHIPRSQEDFEEIKSLADASMMIAKRQREAIVTHGTSTYMLSE